MAVLGRNALTTVVALGVLSGMSACRGRGAASAPVESRAADRLSRAAETLRQPLEIEGQPPETWPLGERMRLFSVPGVSVAVIENGRLATARAWGVTVTGGGDPVTTETMFQAGSLSKPVTALLALALVGDGVLDLDRPVNGFLRSWKVPDNEFTRATPVTLRHILTHQAGLTRFGYIVPRSEGAVPGMAELLGGEKRNWPAVTVDFEPGTRHAYSNPGFCVLQLALEDVSGRTLHDLATVRLFAPLGMRHSTFDEPLAPRVLEAAAAGHHRRRAEDGSGSEPVMVAGRAEMAPGAAGGLWSTPSDLARAVEEVLRARSGESRRILTAELANAFVTAQTPGEGLGIHLEGAGPALRARHGGGMTGFVADLVFYPGAGLGAVVMSNSDGGGFLNEELLAGIAHAFRWPGYPVRRRLAKAAPEGLGELVGVYGLESFPESTFTVRLENDVPTGQVGRHPPFELAATTEPDLFVLPRQSLEVVFGRSRDGRVETVTLRRAGQTGNRYRRVGSR